MEPAPPVLPGAPEPEPTPAALPLLSVPSEDDADIVASWGTSPLCIGLSTDARPPACTDKTRCYELELMDLSVRVVALASNGPTPEEVQRHFDEGRRLVLGGEDVKACFAHEIDRGRPPSGEARIELAGLAGGCAEGRVVSRSVGQKTAECVRDTLKRLVLPPGKGKLRLELDVTVEGL